MNFTWGSVSEIAIILWVMTEADLRFPLTPDGVLRDIS